MKTNPMRSSLDYRWYKQFMHTRFVCTYNKTLLCFITEIKKNESLVAFVFLLLVTFIVHFSQKPITTKLFDLIGLRWNNSYINKHNFFYCNTAKLFRPHWKNIVWLDKIKIQQISSAFVSTEHNWVFNQRNIKYWSDYIIKQYNKIHFITIVSHHQYGVHRQRLLCKHWIPFAYSL